MSSNKKNKTDVMNQGNTGLIQDKILNSIQNVDNWVIRHDYKGYEPFDGLSSFLRIFTFRNWFLERVLQQVILRCPFHIRPLCGVKPLRATKAMGFLAKGYIYLWKINKDDEYKKKALFCMDWLMENQSKGYAGACWGNSFDYAARPFQLPKHVPTVVWTSFIGNAFLDSYEAFKIKEHLETAKSACTFILKDLGREKTDKGTCISYVPFKQVSLHNSNMLAAGFLARIYKHEKNHEAFDLAREAVEYSCERQLDNGAWYYGEDTPYNWIDNWHSAYMLDGLKYYIDSTKDTTYKDKLKKGFDFYINNFFEPSGRPNYYYNRLFVVDIQSNSQAIDTLANFSEFDTSALNVAQKVAEWTIDNMQHKSGYFYYRKLKWKNVKIPMLHWGQATMLCGLSHLLLKLHSGKSKDV